MDFRHESLDSNDKNTKPSNNDYTSEDRRPKNSNKTRNYTEYQDQSFLQDLTQEEIKLFKQEGDKIYDQMNSMNEEKYSKKIDRNISIAISIHRENCKTRI
ncbi:hypothetical protein SSS_09991 [Sarcoptes scabiei]|nr:hypothetical protein SSS_09991 [Sarcoptes scabiei]